MKIPRLIAFPVFVIPWILAFIVIGYIAVNRFPPNGKFFVTTILDGKSPFINPFLPGDRVSKPREQNEGWTGQRVYGDPTYFTARVPGPYSSANVEIEFLPVRQPLLEFGIVRYEVINDLELHPMYSSELELEDWRQTENGYVRKGSSVDIFNQQNESRIAVWFASSVTPLLNDSSSTPIETPLSLRGGHDFYFVPADGSLNVNFSLQDVNRKRGTTVAVFRVFNGEDELKRDVITTNASRETTMGKVMEHRIALKDIQPGVYKISFQADDDVFLRSIKTTSRHWVVGPRLNVGDVVGYATTTFPAKAWTNSMHVVAETFHGEGLQTVSLGKAKVDVVRTHETFRLDRVDSNSNPVLLSAPEGDIRFVGDGWFALREDAFFEPKPKRFTDGTDLDFEKLDGVKTSYERPEQIGDGWLRASFSFPLSGNEDRLRFVLGAPGILSRVGAVDVRKISITYERPVLDWNAWMSLIVQEMKNAWGRL
jgi:hypothetical protein